MTRRPFLTLAQHFLIYRYGESVNWRCTYTEIAAATGINSKTVSIICRRYGYRLNADPVPVDAYFAEHHTEAG